MPQFYLDESGDIPFIGKPLEFHDLDGFTQGYIEALFFTENEPGTSREERVTESGKVRKAWTERVAQGQQKDIPGDYGFADLDPETLAKIISDCRAFQEAHEALLERAYRGERKNAYDEQRAGNDFWYTRNGHGVGYWDRDFEDSTVGDELTAVCGWHSKGKACPYFGEVWSEVGDDGKVYLTG